MKKTQIINRETELHGDTLYGVFQFYKEFDNGYALVAVAYAPTTENVTYDWKGNLTDDSEFEVTDLNYFDILNSINLWDPKGKVVSVKNGLTTELKEAVKEFLNEISRVNVLSDYLTNEVEKTLIETVYETLCYKGLVNDECSWYEYNSETEKKYYDFVKNLSKK